MNITFTKLNDKFPKKAKRSDRTMKKLHLGSYAETCIDVYIPFKNKLDRSLADSDDTLFDRLLDAVESVTGRFETCGLDLSHFTIMYCVNTSTFDVQKVEHTVTEILRALSEVDQAFAEVQEVTVTHGDAWYGEW